MRRLRAEAAILRARAGLGVDDGAEMNFVALELFADAVGPRQQIQNVGGGFEVEKPRASSREMCPPPKTRWPSSEILP
jgi:hypothetical protein